MTVTSRRPLRGLGDSARAGAAGDRVEAFAMRTEPFIGQQREGARAYPRMRRRTNPKGRPDLPEGRAGLIEHAIGLAKGSRKRSTPPRARCDRTSPLQVHKEDIMAHKPIHEGYHPLTPNHIDEGPYKYIDLHNKADDSN